MRNYQKKGGGGIEKRIFVISIFVFLKIIRRYFK
jgi:hypothetical protein